MNTPVNLIFQKFDELDSTVEFINWLLNNENELLKTEKEIIVKAFDYGNSTFFNEIANDGIEYYDSTFYLGD
jgi:hypothetical protein